MTNHENKVVYLTAAGSKYCFSNDKMVGLPVIPTDPIMCSGEIIYGDTFVEFNGDFFRSAIGNDAFSEHQPDAETIHTAQVNYLSHRKMMQDRFGPIPVDRIDVANIKDKPQTDPIPTLEERYKIK